MENEPRFEGEEMKLPTEKVSDFEPNKAEEETKGIFIVVLGVALVLILIGLFMWYKAAQDIGAPAEAPSRPTLETNKEPETTTATAHVESFGAMSTSDELTAIEADLESTNLDSMDSELTQIDSELEASLEY